jgi:Fe-S cluster assembly ATP-binding protein
MSPKSAQLQIKNLKVSIEGKAILSGVNLEVKPGQLHAIMGPNGSGKSTMAAALSGHPAYSIGADSRLILDGTSILELSPDQRANLGLFLAFQYPVEVPGVKVQNFLRLAYQARFKDQADKQFDTVLAFRKHLESIADSLKVDKELLKRGLNEGFSGGEKKQLEIVQMALLEPKYAILDETDSGLDIDAIKKVAEGVKLIQKKHRTGILVITHYQRLLDYLIPDAVSIMVAGQIVQTGTKELVKELEKGGYARYT